jgi:uncharacterized membrane protein YozB (DUF420 family)
MIPLEAFPALNAGLNGLAAGFLVLGFHFIRAGRRQAHRACMLTATGVSTLFLTSYLYYHFHAGSTRFQGVGVIRAVYFGILLTHTVLAAVVPVMVLMTLWLAFRKSFERHRRLARWTLPIWLYVSVTGVVVYWMLYHLQV